MRDIFTFSVSLKSVYKNKEHLYFKMEGVCSYFSKLNIDLHLDVDIGAWNPELALAAANAGYLDVLEFRIGNRA